MAQSSGGWGDMQHGYMFSGQATDSPYPTTTPMGYEYNHTHTYPPHGDMYTTHVNGATPGGAPHPSHFHETEQPNPYGGYGQPNDRHIDRNLIYGEAPQPVHASFQRNTEPYQQSVFYGNGTSVSHAPGGQFTYDLNRATSMYAPAGHDHTSVQSSLQFDARQTGYHPQQYADGGHHTPYSGATSASTATWNDIGDRSMVQPQLGVSNSQTTFPQSQYTAPGYPPLPYEISNRQTPVQQLQQQPASGQHIQAREAQEAAPATTKQLQGAVQLPSTPTAGSQATPIVGPQDKEIWVQPEGCFYVEISNPPTTRLGTFGELGSSTATLHTTRILPQRRTRLPCEIQKNIEILREELNESVDSAKRETIQSQIDQLNNEPVILANPPGSKPARQPTKPKAGTKRKAASMDPNKKPGSSGDGAHEENLTDSVARKIKDKKRPADYLKAVEYDVISILWRDPKRPEPSLEAVQQNVTAFGNYVTDLWSKSKKLKADMEEALAKNDRTKSESLRVSMENKYGSIRAAIETALKFGEKFTISQLGIHMKLLGGLFVMLRNFFQAGDYNGLLPKAIMRLASLFVTVDTEFLKDKVKFDKVYLKYKNELDVEGRGYLDKVFDNAKKRSSLKALDERGDAKNEEVKKPQTGISKKPSTSAKDSPAASKALPPKKDAPVKKSIPDIKKMQFTDYSGLGSARKVSKRPGDEDVDLRAPKKTALENATGAPAAKLQPTSASTSSPASSANAQARARPSGSMLPGRSRVPAKAQPKKATPPVSSSSTIGNILDEISNPKEKPKQAEEPARAPETPEETARRLRKESRRHLHVAWKPDHVLTEVRIFEHDTAEDKGRDQNMLRDAGDNRSEGQMLKQRVRDVANNDDDDDGAPEEINLRPYPTPEAFSSSQKAMQLSIEKSIRQEVRDKNFVTRGGLRPVESDQKKVMEEHESRELMAIYTSVSEIPESPRSPSHRFREEVKQRPVHVLPSTPSMWQESLKPNVPKRVEIHRRWAEHRQFGPVIASQLALQRCRPAHSNNSPATYYPTNHATTASRPRTAEETSAEVLALLKSDKAKGYVDPDPYDPKHPKTQRRHDYADPKVQRDADALEDVFAQFKDKPYRTTGTFASISSNPEPVAEWHADRTIAANTNQSQPQIDIPQILQQVQALTQSAAVPAPAPAPVAPVPNQNLQAVLAALAITQTGAVPQATPVSAQAQQAELAQAWAANWAQNLTTQYNGAYGSQQPGPAQSYGAQSQPLYNAHAQPPSGHVTQPQVPQTYGGVPQPAPTYGDYSPYPQSQDAQSQRDHNERNSRADFHRGVPSKDQKGINRSLIGTKPCTFWAKGQCAKGDKCTFRHNVSDLPNRQA
ncbi:hypothetical protein F4818DRAFT_304417 [Hypoxylon cercidicola]|nr:hypothetical protein F4818DRAFT_304417 [Hypoxylon cercidicola]